MLGKINVSVDASAMVATVVISEDGYEEITSELVMKELKENGIKAGFDEDVIMSIEDNPEYNKEYIVAKGKEPINGKDAYYVYLFKREENVTKPKIRPDGTVDYSPVISQVKEGQKIASYHPARNGSFGYTVFAAMIAPPPTKDVSVRLGKGVEYRDKDVYACIDGQPTLVDNVLEINRCLVVNKDAGYSDGNVNFGGDVHIKGDIRSGVRIECKGNLEIDGIVEGALIKAGKDIVIHGGIHGMETAVIEAGGSLTTTFIEEASVIAGENITFDHMINARLHAGQKVHACGRKGIIIGGRVTAEVCIEANRVGNDSNIYTELVLSSKDFEKKMKQGVIIHFHIRGKTSIEFEGTILRDVVSEECEFHKTGAGIEQFELGKYVYPSVEELVKERKKAAKPLVLLVDDDPLILRQEYAYLNENYRVACISKPLEVLLFLHKQHPDLILLDYMMPRMNGYELLEKIREDESCKDIPVMFLTAVKDKEKIMDCLKLYPQGYLIKPLGKEELNDAVDKFFARGNEE